MMGVTCDARQEGNGEPHATITTEGNVQGTETDTIAENMVFGKPQAATVQTL